MIQYIEEVIVPSVQQQQDDVKPALVIMETGRQSTAFLKNMISMFACCQKTLQM